LLQKIIFSVEKAETNTAKISKDNKMTVFQTLKK